MSTRSRRSRRRRCSKSAKVVEIKEERTKERNNAFNSLLGLLVYLWTGSGLKCSLSPMQHSGPFAVSSRQHFEAGKSRPGPPGSRPCPPGSRPGPSGSRPGSSGSRHGPPGSRAGLEKDEPAVEKLLKKFSRTWSLLKGSRTELMQMAYWKKLVKMYHKIVPRLLGGSLGADRIKGVVASLTHQVQAAYTLTFPGRARHRTGEGIEPRGRWSQGKVKLLLHRLAASSRGGTGLLPRWLGKVRIPRSLFTRWPMKARLSAWRKTGNKEEGEGVRRWIKSLGGRGVLARAVGGKSVGGDGRFKGKLSIKSPSSSYRSKAGTRRHDDVIRKYNKRMSLYKRMPLKAISRLWGWFNQLSLPTWLRVPAFSLYIWLFNCDLSEAALQDLSAYNNLSAFFQRKLKPGVRPIDRSMPLTSPADGRVLFCGRVENEVLEQVKGVTYSLEEFLGCQRGADKSSPENTQINGQTSKIYSHLLNDPVHNALYQCIIYLAPGDYHHFHSAADWTVLNRKHFPGELFSVNPSIARWLQGLFSLNERAVYSGVWGYGFFSLTAVGATNVGSIQVRFDQALETNKPIKYPPGTHFDVDFTGANSFTTRTKAVSSNVVVSSPFNLDNTRLQYTELDAESVAEYSNNVVQVGDNRNNEIIAEAGSSKVTDSQVRGIEMLRGQPFGKFNLGSTIVLIFEAPADFRFTVRPDDRVVYGQGIGTTLRDL